MLKNILSLPFLFSCLLFPHIAMAQTPVLSLPAISELGGSVRIDGTATENLNGATWTWYLNDTMIGGGTGTTDQIVYDWIPEELGRHEITLRTTLDENETSASAFIDILQPHTNLTRLSYPQPIYTRLGVVFHVELDAAYGVTVRWRVDNASPVGVSASPINDETSEANYAHVFTNTGWHEVTVEFFIFDVWSGESTFRINVEQGPGSENGRDTDGDGILDEVEDFYGLDRFDPNDVNEDPDEDGISSGDEIAAGTGPFVSNAPSAPFIIAPLNNADVQDDFLRLSVGHSIDPDGDEVEYSFSLRNQGENRVIWSASGIESSAEGANIVVSAELTDDQNYCWSSRGCDRRACGPWSERTCFTLDLENQVPTAPVLLRPYAVSGTTRPIFALLNATDDDGDSLSYQFHVGPSSDPFQWSETVPEDPSNVTTWNAPAELNDTTDYVWGASAIDPRGGETSANEELTFTVDTTNQPPSEIVIITPSDESFSTSRNVAFVIENATDPENDDLLIEARMSLDPTFENALRQSEQADPSGFTTLFFEVPSSGTWYIEAWATDSSTEGPHAAQTIIVRTNNEAPQTPTIIRPNDTIVTQLRPVLEVAPVVDPEGDEVRYAFILAYDAQCSLPIAIGEVEAGSESITWQTTAILENTKRYYWRSRAIDQFESASLWSETQNFRVQITPSAPEAPTIIFPTAGDKLPIGTGIVLSVQNAFDLDSEILTYFFEIASDETFTSNVELVANVPQGNGTTSVLLPGNWVAGHYFWRAYASDGEVKGEFSTIASFDITRPTNDDGSCNCTNSSSKSPFLWSLILLIGLYFRRNYSSVQ